jgi:hypothetical protein
MEVVARTSKHCQAAMEKDCDASGVARMSEHYKAAMAKDWKKLEEICLETGTAGFPITVARDTAVHIAVHSGRVDLVRKLQEEIIPTEIRVTNNRGDTVLHEAAAVGNVPMAEFLLGHDKDLLVKNKRGETPLFRAAASDQIKMVSFLAGKAMERGTMKNHIRKGATSIIHIAVCSRYFGRLCLSFT